MKSTKAATLGVMLTLVAAPMASQVGEGRAGGATLGSAFERAAGAVHRLEGIPSSAVWGDRQSDLKFLRTATAAGLVVGVAEGTGSAWLLQGELATLLDEVQASATGVALSPEGRSAVFYSEERATMQVVTGLPQAPRLAWAAAVSGMISRLAVSDDGKAVAMIAERGVEVVTAEHPPQWLFGAAKALAFAAGSRRLVVGTADAVAWLDADTGAVNRLMEAQDGLADAVAVGVSADGGRVFVAMTSGRIAIRPTTGGNVEFVSCACTPSRLTPLRGPAAFLLNEAEEPGETLWILDAGRPDPGVAFVARKAKVAE